MGNASVHEENRMIAARGVDDRAKIVMPDGMSVGKPTAKMAPPQGSSPFFGWTDFGGDENGVRFEEIAVHMKMASTGKYVVVLKNGQQMAIPAVDYARLLKRMGWSEGKLIERE